MDVSKIEQADLEMVKLLLEFTDRADFKVTGRETVPLARAMDWLRQAAGKMGLAWQEQRKGPTTSPEKNVTPPEKLAEVKKKK